MRTTSLWGVAAKWLVPTGLPTWKKILFESPRMKLRRYCQQLGLCLFPPCYFIFLEPCYVRGISVFFVLCIQLSQQARPHQGPCLSLGVLFSQFILVCFIICKKIKVLFVLVQQTCDFVASLGQGLGLGQRFLPFTVFSLGLHFCLSCYIVHLRCKSEGGSQSRCLTRPRILSLSGIVRERLLPCRVVVTAKWVVSCTRITCIQPVAH